jgi:hypothetical protein
MTDNEVLQHLEQRVTDLETLIQGKITDGMNGGSIIHVLARLVETVYGPKDDPSAGIVHQMKQQNDKIERLLKLVYMGGGGAFVIGLLWSIFQHFHKP